LWACWKRWVSMHTETVRWHGRQVQCSGRLFEVIAAATLKLRLLSSVDVFDMGQIYCIGLSLYEGRKILLRFGTTVCKTVRPVLSDCCLSVLSVSDVGVFVYYDQTDGWIKMKPGTEVGLGPGHIVLDGDPAFPSPKGAALNFRPMSAVAKLLDGSKYRLVGSRPLRRRQCVIDENPAPLSKKGHNSPRTFRSMSVAAKRLDGSRCHLV